MFLPQGPIWPFLAAIINCLSIPLSDSGTGTPLSFSSQVSHAAFDKFLWPQGWNLSPQAAHSHPWRDTAPTGSHPADPSAITGVFVPKLSVWQHILVQKRRKRIKATACRGTQRLSCICRIGFPPTHLSQPQQITAVSVRTRSTAHETAVCLLNQICCVSSK